jgi:hypothetical protein
MSETQKADRAAEVALKLHRWIMFSTRPEQEEIDHVAVVLREYAAECVAAEREAVRARGTPC